MTDFHIELFQLACHLVRATPPLLDVWDSPSSLLATLAALFPERITTVPGEGVFLRPYSDPDGENPPQSCWLNYAPGPTPFAPAHFHHLESTLTAHSSNSPLPMFSSAIPLGPSACVYLNPGLLPPPRLAPPVIKNEATPDPHCGGWGAIQYYYHFRPDSGAIPLDDPDPTEPIPILSITCPESQTIASPNHGITFCNGPARTARAYSHGPSLAQADWHRIISDTSGYWQGDHRPSLATALHPYCHLGSIYHPCHQRVCHPHIPEPGVFTLMAFTAPLIVSFNYHPHL